MFSPIPTFATVVIGAMSPTVFRLILNEPAPCVCPVRVAVKLPPETVPTDAHAPPLKLASSSYDPAGSASPAIRMSPVVPLRWATEKDSGAVSVNSSVIY